MGRELLTYPNGERRCGSNGVYDRCDNSRICEQRTKTVISCEIQHRYPPSTTRVGALRAVRIKSVPKRALLWAPAIPGFPALAATRFATGLNRPI